MACRFEIADSPVGSILVGESERGVLAVLLGSDSASLQRALREKFPEENFTEGGTLFSSEIVACVEGRARLLSVCRNNEEIICSICFQGEDTSRQIPLDIRGTQFQKAVWDQLCLIPSGETRSYSDIAHQIGAPRSVRAVAAACGANPIAVIIPCHRVVRKNGDLSGYRWGIERKKTLLGLEQSAR